VSTSQIGSETRDLCSFDESWVTQQIIRRPKEGENACVQVHIETTGVNVSVATPGCGGGGGGRPPSSREREIIEEWQSRGLNSADFSPGNLVSFLKQIGRSVC
jgi:hypothetical protein